MEHLNQAFRSLESKNTLGLLELDTPSPADQEDDDLLCLIDDEFAHLAGSATLYVAKFRLRRGLHYLMGYPHSMSPICGSTLAVRQAPCDRFKVDFELFTEFGLEDRSRGGTARGAWRRRRAATGGARSRLRGWQRRGWQRRGWQRVSWRGWKRWRRAIHSRRAAGGRRPCSSRRGQPGGRHRGQRRGGQIVELQEAPPLLLGELRRPQGVREHLCVAPARGVDRGPVL